MRASERRDAVRTTNRGSAGPGGDSDRNGASRSSGYRGRSVRSLPPDFPALAPENREEAVAALAAILLHAMEQYMAEGTGPGGADGHRARGADPLLTPKEVAALLQVPVATIYTWRYQSIGPPGVRLGKHLRFRRSEVEAWIESQKA